MPDVPGPGGRPRRERTRTVRALLTAAGLGFVTTGACLVGGSSTTGPDHPAEVRVTGRVTSGGQTPVSAVMLMFDPYVSTDCRTNPRPTVTLGVNPDGTYAGSVYAFGESAFDGCIIARARRATAAPSDPPLATVQKSPVHFARTDKGDTIRTVTMDVSVP